MATELARNVRGTRNKLGKELRNRFVEASNQECEPLTFGDIVDGNKFISMPMPGDNHGHGGFLNGSYLFVKTELICDPRTPTNATRVFDGSHVHFKDHMYILKIE
ncbi:MAG: hypothetical protein Q7K55_07210 [Candidatus Levybacteria bacterium]|nr:hypothetical protein [Candidatus Levybacteria bacterium]